jgi:hypothetical protein
VVRTVSIAEVGISLVLPAEWTESDKDAVAEWNATLRRADPKSRVVALAAFEKYSLTARQAGFAPYILISKTPGRISARELLAVPPSFRGPPPLRKLLDEREVEASTGRAYFDETLKMVVVPIEVNSAVHGKCIGRTFEVPTRHNLVTISVVGQARDAHALFGEVERALLTLKLTEREKISADWIEDLKSLLGR